MTKSIPLYKLANVYTMEISKHKTTEDIKKSFSSKFNNLKIEFFKAGHVKGQGNKPEEQIVKNALLSELSEKVPHTVLDLSENQTIADLEKEFKSQFDLNVQVFRKSNDVWLETIQTDDWTLEEANKA